VLPTIGGLTLLYDPYDPIVYMVHPPWWSTRQAGRVIVSQRAADLASKLESANAEVIAAIESASDEDWKRLTPSEGWSIGVTARHIAISTLPIAGLVELVANGGDIPVLTMDMFHAGNAQHAEENADCTCEEVLEILRRDGPIAVAKLRALTDAQLDSAAAMAFAGGAEMSAQQIAEGILIAHPVSHLASIKAAYTT
jgi:hypothetical protein